MSCIPIFLHTPVLESQLEALMVFLPLAVRWQGGGLVFAYAQLAYGGCLLLSYWVYFLFFHKGQVVTLFPFRYRLAGILAGVSLL
jgi:hypothetical protein